MTYSISKLQYKDLTYKVIDGKKVAARPKKTRTPSAWLKEVWAVMFGKLDTLEWPRGQ